VRFESTFGYVTTGPTEEITMGPMDEETIGPTE
jgi:hypothetical protein